MKKKLPLYVKILSGMAAGILLGFVAVWLGFGDFVQDWVSPWGTIFIRLLKLIAIPLVFLSLVLGISNLQNIRRLSRMGLKTLLIYVGTTVCAIVVGLAMVYLIKPGEFFPTDKVREYRIAYNETISQRAAEAQTAQDESPMQFILDMIPENMIAAAGNNNKMLQIIFIAILFGLALIAVERKKVQPVIDVVSGLNEVVLKIIHYVMAFAPWGVMALMADLVVGFAGDGAVFAALGMYVVTLAVALMILITGFYPLLLRIFTKKKIGAFFRAIMPVQLVAFTTSSSAATLPVTMERVENELGVSNGVASFVLPVGVTINMDGTSCYQAVAVIFIAQVLGMDLSFTQLLTVIAVATISSIGTPGVPGGSVVMLMLVLGSVGIPAEWMALILGVDRPLDMMRTVVNVTGDATVACIIDEGESARAVADT